jgi:hypothetical protein
VIQVSGSEIDFIKHSVTQVSSTQVSSTQIYAGELPLFQGQALKQFLSSHNYALQNTTVPTWTSFLTGTTPFNLNIEVTDLPRDGSTGRCLLALAIAQLTGFATNGTPTFLAIALKNQPCPNLGG